MIILSGITVLAQIYESDTSLVYRGIRNEDERRIILKLLKEDYPAPGEIIRYRQEYEITRNLKIDGVVKAYDLQQYHNTLVMILEDFGGTSLNILPERYPLNLDKFLSITIQITEILGQIHQENIIHKDINPSNIAIDPETGQLKIIDFGISTILSRENPTLTSPNVLEGTLAYISPEQTGRMNRTIDYRTDFYSLGVTFYELLTSQLPFTTTEAMELVHCHIAKQPIPPHEINPEIPLVVSEIVMKLLAKTAEERYQSALGIRDDLVLCLIQLEAGEGIEYFIPGEQDISSKFQIPQKLYGREEEIKDLLTAFNRVCQGNKSEMMLVSGYSGIGKSALVQEIYKPITQERGYFIAGKFDQFQRNIPYSALVGAFRELVRQLLTESEAKLQLWRDKLLGALGVNGQIIIDVIPEVELIIGKQSDVPKLAPSESQNRFNLVWQNFIRVFCQKEHPLVIFIDDLQWADSATLKLIQLIMMDIDTKYLFLIGSYRDNEVNSGHPLMLTLSEVQKYGATVNTVYLSPLNLTHIAGLIADTLNCNNSRAKPLAELVLAKTQGNPFFMNEFLKSLYTEKLLNFDFTNGVWWWDLEQIQARGITDNVVELMAANIQKLPESTEHLLKLAACIGSQFDLRTLSIVNETSQKETANQLKLAVEDGLIFPVGDDYKWIEVSGFFGVGSGDENRTYDGSKSRIYYKFVHDRIQQAAYSLIPDPGKAVIHVEIGEVLLNNTPIEQREDTIFDIVNQLNFGIDLIDNQEERDDLAKLNLIAGKKAKASAAYQPALTYLKLGLKWLAGDRWQRQYDTTLALYVEAAESAYLCGDFDEMEQLASGVLDRAEVILDKVKVYEVKIYAYIAQNKLQEAVVTGLAALRMLGINLPKKTKNIDILLALFKTKFALLWMQIDDLIHLKEMTDPDKLAAMRILNSLGSATYFVNPSLSLLTILNRVSLSIKHGNTSLSPMSYAAYGLLLCGALGDIKLGCHFGKVALHLLDKFNAKEIECRTVYLVNFFIRNWQEHVGQILEPLLENYKTGIETGDLEYAAYCAISYCNYAYFIGEELGSLEREIAKYSDAIGKLKQQRSLHAINIDWQKVLNLMGESENPCHLIGKAYDDSKIMPHGMDEIDLTAKFHLYFYKLMLCYLFGEDNLARDNAIIAEKYLEGGLGMLTVPMFHFYDSLAILALYPSSPKLQQKCFVRKVQANQKKMKKWAAHAPMNHLHKFYLVEAERYRIFGKDIKGMDYYDKAIALAKENKYLNEEALGYELAAKFYLEKGKDKIAQIYMQDARYCYLRWGAMAKVKDLDTRYPQLLHRKSSGMGLAIAPISMSSTITGNSPDSTLDLTTVIKASQTLFGEIVLDKLLAKLMEIIIENAGAQKGFLILETKGKLLIEASGAVPGVGECYGGKDCVKVLQSIPIATCDGLSPTIINYVARTLESVVLNDATREGLFSNDSYIKANQPKSILCFPLIDRGKMEGIIYLENNLTTGAFTQDRIEILNLLSAQAAIAIENARFYHNMAELNKAYERFVPRQFLQFLGKESIVDVKLGDQVQREMSVLFSDIRSFTTLSEIMTPEENFKFINSYLSQMEPIITQHQGFIDKYIGDAIMALFSGEADNAVKAGISMLHHLVQYNQNRAKAGYVPIKIGIGINTGSLMLGTVGGYNRMDSTVISDAVNLASRVETLTKSYGVSMLITHQTLSRLTNPDNYALRLIEKGKVKGKSELVIVYEIFDADPPEIKDGKLVTKEIFLAALSHYNFQRFREAGKLFSECLRLNPMDGVAQIYQERCLEMEWG
ncbi:AAA family ATPase [Limnofasciculus baicalensis]|uniref:AAA family ATPase n=1 Tax=Limnofasciculus baicalensis BBK-W-15 TaxID=2699891 RepID=A0AAE3KKN1_9CYAN|nr:AAA family ATPase [Limnofasciculus baicalensis]MCP2727710.1 AAA family ATPase [Limnofasciculus baicalensis BBK-W-15]